MLNTARVFLVEYIHGRFHVEDPIVSQLRVWLLESEDPRSVPPPVYPAIGTEDLRSIETPPPELAFLDVVRAPLHVLFFCM